MWLGLAGAQTTGSGFEWGGMYTEIPADKNVRVTGLTPAREGTLLVDPYKRDNPGIGIVC